MQATSSPTTSSARISDPRVLLATRVGWLALLIFCVSFTLLSIPPYLKNCGCPVALVAQWEQLGIAQIGRTALATGSALLTLMFFVMALLVFIRRGSDPVALGFSVAFLIAGAGSFPRPNIFEIRILDIIATTLSNASLLALLYLIYLFPDGRFIPSWTRWPLLAVIVYGIIVGIQATYADTLIFAGAAAIGVYSLVRRSRQVENPVQRQQIKLFIYAISLLVVAVLCYGVFWQLTKDNHSLEAAPYKLAVEVTLLFLIVSIPFILGMSILRLRLWDIDLVINRTLVYGFLTIILGTLFFVALLLLQPILRSVIGSDQSGIATIGSTAAVMLAFNPTRRSLQTFVDKRFFKLRVDMNKLAAQQKIRNTPPKGNEGLWSNRTLGAYTVSDLLGRGGMGEVYLGQHPTLDRTVAIKILPSDLAEQSAFRSRFEIEAKTVAALRHSNIVNVFDFGQAGDTYYMVMEYIQGQDLGDILRQHGAMPLEKAQPIIEDIANALDYAHAQGIIHRDIKPSNVMLQPITSTSSDSVIPRTHRAILMDFGIAKLLNTSTGLTQSGLMVGTVDYAAPEQIAAAKEVDHRADIYALSVMAYQMLTGKLPFSGTLMQLVFAHMQQPPPDPRELVPSLNVSIAQAVIRAMSKEPDLRFKSAGEFAAAFSN